MSDLELLRATSLLGLHPSDLRGLQTRDGLAALKAKAKRAYKAAAMRLHPDRTGGDEAKAEDFKLVNGFLRELERLEVTRPRRRVTYSIKVSVRVRPPMQ